MFAGSTFRVLGGVVFSSLLVVACASDLRARRIPNKLVAVLAIAGLEFSVATMPWLDGLRHGVGGLLSAFAIWIPLYALRWIGAGDVKLFTACGAWLGPAGALEASVVAGLAGGVLALAQMLWQRGLGGTAISLWVMKVGWRGFLEAPTGVPTKSRLPYGVALALGAAVVAWSPGILL